MPLGARAPSDLRAALSRLRRGSGRGVARNRIAQERRKRREHPVVDTPHRRSRPAQSARPRQQVRPQPRPQSRPAHQRPQARKSPTRTTSWSGSSFQRRVRLVRLVLVVALLFMVGRLVDVQIIHSGSYQTAARNESSTPITLNSLRGGIYARDGAPLALSVPTDDVIADNFQIAHPVKTAAALSPLLHVPAATLAPLLRRHSGYVVLAKQISQSDGQKLAADAIPGITLVDDSRRVVTNGNLASPVIGITNAANKGAAGIEYADNRLLSGTAGKETLIESPSGVALPSSSVADRVSSRAGQGVELTLDTQLQYESEQVLAQSIESSQALGGMAVVMDVKTGQILSMANLVSTHPNAPVTATPPASTATAGGVIPIGPKDAVNEAPNDNAVTQLYEPGSVFKLVTFSAALQDGLINPNSVFTVPDQITLDGSNFHDADPHPTERLTATQILAQSSNIGTSEIAQGLGEQRLLAQVGNLGFGKPTGLDFPGESAGLVATAAQWEPTDYVSLPIGQVDAVSALQVLDAYNAVANGGTFVQPKLVQATVSQSGAVTQDGGVTHASCLLAVRRFRAHLHARAGRLDRNRVQRHRAGLHRGRKDRDGPDPHDRARMPTPWGLHGLVRRLCAGRQSHVLHDRGARSTHADLRWHRGRSRVFPDHELCPPPLRHSHHARSGDAGSGRGIAQQPSARHHVSRYHQRADGGKRGAPVLVPLCGQPCEPCR